LIKRLQLVQYALAAIGVIGIMVSIMSNDITGIVESCIIIFMAIIAGFLDSYVKKKQGTKNKI
jgi:CDP-diglyceride synthetase